MSPSLAPETELSLNENQTINPCAVGPCVERSAFYFTSQNEALFAWLHRPARIACLSHGVVICAPIGAEQIHSHRAMRHLADAIAELGLPVLRFDYHGTGDSAGTDEDPQRMSAWLANIQDAIRWLQTQLGCREVSLVGLRLGATLATLVSQDFAVDNLVLWSPIVQGKRYVRELKAVARLAGGSTSASEPENENITAAGFVMAKETADSICQIDLLRVTPRCPHALIIDRDDASNDTRLCDSFRAKEISVDHSVQPGYLEMMAEPHFTRVPHTAIRKITSWFANKVTTGSLIDHEFPFLQPTTSAAGIGASTEEVACCINEDPHLFGVLTQSVQQRKDDKPLIVLLNAGACHHVGPARLHVQIARQLSEHGFRTLRIDACGLGDSILADSLHENDTYAASIFRDIDLTLKYAQEQLSAEKVVLIGLCSGAYAAFQSAAQSASPTLVESVLINPLTFFWQDGMSLEAAVPNPVNAWHYYLNAMFDSEKWLNLLSGKTEAGFVGTFRRFAQRVVPLKSSSTVVVPRTSDACTVTRYSHPAKNNLSGDLDRIVRAKRQLAMFISDSDPGHFLMMFHARRKANQLMRTGQLTCHFIENADHTFSNPTVRQTLIHKLADYLCRRYTHKT